MKFIRKTSPLWLALFLAACAAQAADEPSAEWSRFKSAFMSPDGRIIDWQNEQRSHSEGQGYAMALAVFFDDRPAFDLAFTWSDRNLGRGLRPWQWGKRPDGQSWGVLDANNAADGDILHAWALLLAGEKWAEPAYTREGATILDLIREELVLADGTLLPGREGFRDDSGLRVNPAYYVFPAFRDFQRFDSPHAEVWQTVRQRGLDLIRAAVRPKTGLLPDWLRLDAQGRLSPRPDDTFGYEAIRVPLYLALGQEADLELFRPLFHQVARENFLADAVTLDGLEASGREALAGEYAALARAAAGLNMADESKALWGLARQRQPSQQGNYYGTVLYILALL